MKERILEKVKRFFCKHTKVVPYQDYLDAQGNGTYIMRHTWRCKHCGKIFFPGEHKGGGR